MLDNLKGKLIFTLLGAIMLIQSVCAESIRDIDISGSVEGAITMISLGFVVIAAVIIIKVITMSNSS